MIVGSNAKAAELGGATLVYDLETSTWIPSNAKRPCVSEGQASVVINNHLYVFGGFGDCAKSIQVYSPETDAFIELVDVTMPFGAGAPAAAYMDGKAYVCGGINPET